MRTQQATGVLGGEGILKAVEGVVRVLVNSCVQLTKS